MKLTAAEQRILNGERGDLLRKFMGILVGIGECFDVTQLVPINSVHVPSVSISTLGEGGKRLIESMAISGLQCQAFTTVNPMATDGDQWRSLGIPEDELEAQFKVAVNIGRLGATPCFTCTPYLIGHVPRFGEHIAWGEISAVIYANSVLGARTNPEGAPSAWASSLTGRTPLYGLHLDENRLGRFVVRVTAELKEPGEYGALALFSGRLHPQLIPVYTGLPVRTNWDGLKAMACGLHLESQAGMFHAVGITPEAMTEEQALGNKKPLDVVGFSQQDLENTMRSLDTDASADVSWVVIGCPHCSIGEIGQIARAIGSRKLNSNVELWVLTSRPVKALADRTDFTETIEKAGGKLLMDTCPDIFTNRTMANMGHKSLTTSASLFAHSMGEYLSPPKPFKNRIHFGRLERCLDAAVSGTWR